jgi:hypothetical protein
MTPATLTKEVRARFNEAAQAFSKNPSALHWETLLRSMMAWQQWQVIATTPAFDPKGFASDVRLINLQDAITQKTLSMSMDEALETFAYQPALNAENKL